MTPALRWAAMRAILMFHQLWGTKSQQDCVHKPQPFWWKRTAKAESSRGPSVLNWLTSPLAGHCLWYLPITAGKGQGCGPSLKDPTSPLSSTLPHAGEQSSSGIRHGNWLKLKPLGGPGAKQNTSRPWNTWHKSVVSLVETGRRELH